MGLYPYVAPFGPIPVGLVTHGLGPKTDSAVGGAGGVAGAAGGFVFTVVDVILGVNRALKSAAPVSEDVSDNVPLTDGTGVRRTGWVGGLSAERT